MVTKLSADRLAAKIDDGDSIALVDTRPADSFEAWHLPDAVNVPYDPRDGLSRADLDTVNAAEGRPVVAICGKGLTSTPFAFELDERGYDDVAVVEGGMEAWSTVYEHVPVETGHEDLVVVQLQRRATGCLGYVVGSRSAGEALVVDATRLTDEFKAAAAEAELTIGHVMDTHVHADHLSGGPALAEAIGVPYRLGEHARDRGVQHEFEPLADGETIELGDVDVQAHHAPGHTSEMTVFRVADELLLTGDTLFVESVGRTELQFGDADAAQGAELLYETLHETILDLPADTRVLPGHVSVSSDGRYEHGSPGDLVSARLGDLERDLAQLQLDRDAFVDRLSSDPPEKPANYETIIGVNTGTEPVDGEGEAAELELGPNNCAA